MLNTRSNHLVILVATCNRLEVLKRVLDSIAVGTTCPHEIIVIDGGSTDGTVSYLQSNPIITPVFQGQLIGAARAYNHVWRQIESRYTCWLSDDTELVSGSLDLAVNILESHPEIGMVGLKVKETRGPWTSWPYKTGISEYGIVNCNHGVLPLKLLRAVGYFNESYHSYNIDPDLTASVLSAGRQVVMTKQISVLHHREWSDGLSKEEIKSRTLQKGIDGQKIYREKFRYLRKFSVANPVRKIIANLVSRVLFFRSIPGDLRAGITVHDWSITKNSRVVSLADPLKTMNRPYHLVQKIPASVLAAAANPYTHLLGQ